MDLTVLAGSRVPNAFALLCTVLLAIVAFRTRAGLRWGFLFMAVAFLGVVLAKNVSYGEIITDFNTDTSPAVRPDYADALRWVVAAQMVIAAFLLIAGMASKKLGWLSAVAALASAYAALCMFGWRQVYLSSEADKPVQYEVWAPLLHWALLAALLSAVVMTMISFTRRKTAKR